MKRLFIIMLTLMTLPLIASAQSALEINQIFGGKYSSDPSVSEIIITGDSKFLKQKRLVNFATFRGKSEKFAPIIQPLVLADASRAIARNLRYKDGKLGYAFLVFPQIEFEGKAVNRYLLYVNGKAGDLRVLYFEGYLGHNEAETLFRSISQMPLK